MRRQLSFWTKLNKILDVNISVENISLKANSYYDTKYVNYEMMDVINAILGSQINK